VVQDGKDRWQVKPMTLLCYVPKKFGPDALDTIAKADAIIQEYEKGGYALTLRSMYYQFVARGWVPENTVQQYNRLGNIVSDARLAGLLSWTAIDDNLRSLEGLATVSGPHEAMKNVRANFRLDLWANQPVQPEVWIEKDAMMGVITGICNELRVNMFACRGYASQSSMWRAGQRMARYIEQGKRPMIFHFGDHDPSGIDMTRDNQERLTMFAGMPVQVVRLGLNMSQVEKYKPPANFAKVNDPRFSGYRAAYGEDSWELDALHPAVIKLLIEDAVGKCRDQKLWDASLAQEAEDMDKIDRIMEEQGWKTDNEE
jgi:hypothetical protein